MSTNAAPFTKVILAHFKKNHGDLLNAVRSEAWLYTTKMGISSHPLE